MFYNKFFLGSNIQITRELGYVLVYVIILVNNRYGCMYIQLLPRPNTNVFHPAVDIK